MTQFDERGYGSSLVRGTVALHMPADARSDAPVGGASGALGSISSGFCKVTNVGEWRHTRGTQRTTIFAGSLASAASAAHAGAAFALAPGMRGIVIWMKETCDE